MAERDELQQLPREDPGPIDEEAEDAEEEAGPVPPEILEGLPKEQRVKIERYFSASMMAVGSIGNPILQKLTPEHISDLIALSSKEVETEHEDKKDTRRILAVLGFAVLAAAVGFACLLAVKQNNDLLIEVIKLGAIAVGGILGGYGIGRTRGRG